MTPDDALAALSAASLILPSEAPEGIAGLYLLHDHERVPRYIGQTHNLRHRIWSNHCVGDLNSHKWVAAYNAGRLWHDSRQSCSDRADGKIAKELRAELARRHCRVRVLPLAGTSPLQLRQLEAGVRAIAPDPMNDWNNQKEIPAIEPVELVDALLDELCWEGNRISALSRQAARWKRLEERMPSASIPAQ